MHDLLYATMHSGIVASCSVCLIPYEFEVELDRLVIDFGIILVLVGKGVVNEKLFLLCDTV